jgi:anti-sigma-K factor RskA
MIIAAIAIGLIVAVLVARAYATWRNRQPLIASSADLWAHTLPYEPSARERRQ